MRVVFRPAIFSPRKPSLSDDSWKPATNSNGPLFTGDGICTVRSWFVPGYQTAARQLLNGSYTTAKKSPGDIDIAVEVPLSGSAGLAIFTLDHPIAKLLLGPLMKSTYHCDAYPIFTLPKSDLEYAAVTVRAIQYWTKWFGRSSSGIPKGRVWATSGGFK